MESQWLLVLEKKKIFETFNLWMWIHLKWYGKWGVIMSSFKYWKCSIIEGFIYGWTIQREIQCLWMKKMNSILNIEYSYYIAIWGQCNWHWHSLIHVGYWIIRKNSKIDFFSSLLIITIGRWYQMFVQNTQLKMIFYEN